MLQGLYSLHQENNSTDCLMHISSSIHNSNISSNSIHNSNINSRISSRIVSPYRTTVVPSMPAVVHSSSHASHSSTPLWLVSWGHSTIVNRLFRQVMLTDLRPAQPVSSFLIMYVIRSTSGATPLAVSLRILMLL